MPGLWCLGRESRLQWAITAGGEGTRYQVLMKAPCSLAALCLPWPGTIGMGPCGRMQGLQLAGSACGITLRIMFLHLFTLNLSELNKSYSLAIEGVIAWGGILGGYPSTQTTQKNTIKKGGLLKTKSLKKSTICQVVIFVLLKVLGKFQTLCKPLLRRKSCSTLCCSVVD